MSAIPATKVTILKKRDHSVAAINEVVKSRNDYGESNNIAGKVHLPKSSVGAIIKKFLETCVVMNKC